MSSSAKQTAAGSLLPARQVIRERVSGPSIDKCHSGATGQHTRRPVLFARRTGLGVPRPVAPNLTINEGRTNRVKVRVCAINRTFDAPRRTLIPTLSWSTGRGRKIPFPGLLAAVLTNSSSSMEERRVGIFKGDEIVVIVHVEVKTQLDNELRSLRLGFANLLFTTVEGLQSPHLLSCCGGDVIRLQRRRVAPCFTYGTRGGIWAWVVSVTDIRGRMALSATILGCCRSSS